jgi:prolyl-tRNA synthetase
VLIAVHGDDRGMILPPKIARIQAVIIPIYNSGNKAVVLEKANEVYASIRNKVRAYIDDNDAYSPGWKFNEWELKGVPIRIELGEKETKSGKVSVVRRDTLEKTEIPISELHNVLPRLLDEIHNSLYNRAKKYMEAHIHEVEDFKKLSEIMEKSMGAARAPWCGSHECEMKIKEDTGAKIANMPFDAQSKAKGKKCILCGKEAKYIADFARSY